LVTETIAQLLVQKKTTKTKKDKEYLITQQYFFNGLQICKKKLFAHAIGKYQLESISKSLERGD